MHSPLSKRIRRGGPDHYEHVAMMPTGPTSMKEVVFVFGGSFFVLRRGWGGGGGGGGVGWVKAWGGVANSILRSSLLFPPPVPPSKHSRDHSCVSTAMPPSSSPQLPSFLPPSSP